jgi:SnoaL-like protein
MTDSRTATSIEAVVDGYFAMWNETDAERRRTVIAATWSPTASYVDPMFTAEGYEGLDALVAGVHQRFPGHRFRLTDTVDTHHERARWGWALVPPDGGAPVAAGVDFAVLAPDGRLGEVTGFFAGPAGGGS